MAKNKIRLPRVYRESHWLRVKFGSHEFMVKCLSFIAISASFEIQCYGSAAVIIFFEVNRL